MKYSVYTVPFPSALQLHMWPFLANGLRGKIRGNWFIILCSPILLPSSIPMMLWNELINDRERRWDWRVLWKVVGRSLPLLPQYYLPSEWLSVTLLAILVCTAVCEHNIKSLSPFNNSMRQGMLLPLLYEWENKSSHRVYSWWSLSLTTDLSSFRTLKTWASSSSCARSTHLLVTWAST